MFQGQEETDESVGFGLLLHMLSTTIHPGGVKKKEDDGRYL